LNNIIAIIPARGGSKGIPRKNITLFKGIPLVAHSIIHGINSKLINRVIVSTEDKEIADISKEYGAEVVYRPVQLAGDEILDWPVFENVLNKLKIDNTTPDIIVHLRPTTPYRKISWIDESITLLQKNKEATSVRSVSVPSQHPYRIFEINPDGYLDPIMKHKHPEPYILRRQELPLLYYYNCVIDITRYKTIMDKKSMTGNTILPYIIDENDVIDIDTPRDLLIAEALYGDTK